MSHRKPSRTSLTSNPDSQSETSSSESGVFFVPGRKLIKNSKYKLKLIALYADHECLWNQCHKDFFNFEHKERVWEAIADEMRLDSPPDFWKHEMHRLRYNVELERLQEQQAKSLGQNFKAKLFYAPNMNFLMNRMFARHKAGPHREIPLQAPSSGVTLEKLPSKQTGAVKEKPKSGSKLAEKLASLEVLRNHHCSRLVLSQEAFQRMQKITSGVDHHHGAREKPMPKAKHV